MLRILQTTDLHAHALAFDYNNNNFFARRGLSRSALQIENAKAIDQPCLLFDTGDFLQGSPIADRLAQEPETHHDTHPMITAMNLLGYDAATIGNHDLDFGIDHLAASLSQANFPFVSANLLLPPHVASQLKRYVILERAFVGYDTPLRIGVTGCLPSITLKGAAGLDPSIACEPIAPALSRAIADMKREGVDIVIVLAHCGREAIEAEITPLHGVDVVLGGHTHELLPAPKQGVVEVSQPQTPVMISGALGEYVGQIDLMFSQGDDAWRIESAEMQMKQNAPKAPESVEIVDALAQDHDETVLAVAKPLGQTTSQIDSFFALVADNSGLQLLAKTFENAVKAKLEDTRWSHLPVLSVAAPVRTGGLNGATHFCHIPAGTIRLRDLDKIYSFPDTLCALLITGKALRVWLEMSASIFNQIPIGSQGQALLNPSFPGYLFDVIPQLTYEIDLSKPALFNERRERLKNRGGRISALTYQGKPVADDTLFVLAASSFRARGVLPEMDEADAPRLILDTGQSCRSILSSYIVNAATLDLKTKPSWRFKPTPNASAHFLTSQRAESKPDCGIEFVRETSQGFAEMRICLSGRPNQRGLASGGPQLADFA